MSNSGQQPRRVGSNISAAADHARQVQARKKPKEETLDVLLGQAAKMLIAPNEYPFKDRDHVASELMKRIGKR